MSNHPDNAMICLSFLIFISTKSFQRLSEVLHEISETPI